MYVYLQNSILFSDCQRRIIKNKCNEIKILPPQELNKNFKKCVDRDIGKIECFPTENLLLFSIFEMAENKLDDDNLEFVNKCIIDMLINFEKLNYISYYLYY